MNEALENLITRRSCRDYKDETISESELDEILEAGTYAPTGRGLQAPLIVAVQNAEDVKKLSEINAEILGVKHDPFYGAKTVVAVLSDANVPTYLEDGSLVMGNLMNAAHAIGVGSCWINRAKETFDREDGKALLKKWGIEGNYKGIGFCILGYENTVTPAKPRKSNYIIKIK